MRTNKPVVAPKRLPQNGGEVLHQLSALRSEKEEILFAHLVYLSHFDLFRNEPRSKFLTTVRTKKIFNVAVVMGGTTPPELRSTRPPKVKNSF